MMGTVSAFVAINMMLGACASAKPNFVMILADDLGWFNVGWNGNSLMKTPFMDKLVAQESLRLDQAYAYKYCSPTRRSFMTGRLPNHVGIKNDLENATIDARFDTIQQKLKREAGYATGMSGKWHAGCYTMGQIPTGRGFDSSIGYFQGMEDHYLHNFTACNNAIDLWDSYDPSPFNLTGTFGDYLYVDRAVNTIRKHDQSKPLFYYLALQVAHKPNEAPPRNMAEYPPSVPSQSYYAMSSVVDEAVANVTSALKEAGMWDNTLVVFSSDNGGPAFAGTSTASNYPQRGSKFGDWQGGVQVASFVTGGLLPREQRGRATNATVHIADYFATFSKLAGVNPGSGLAEPSTGPREHINPESELQLEDSVPPLDSVDQWPVLSGQSTQPARTETYLTENAVMQGPWKLIQGKGKKQLGDAQWSGPLYPKVPANGTAAADCSAGCLYHVLEDPREEHDLAKEQPSRAKELLGLLNSYRQTNFEPQVPGVSIEEVCAKTAKNGGRLTPADWKESLQSSAGE